MSASDFPKLFLTKRSNGRYYLRIVQSDHSTHWKTTHCRTKSTALTFLNSYKIELSKLSEIKIPLLSTYLKTFSSFNKGSLRPRTLHSYMEYGTLLLNHVGDKPIDKYTPTEFEHLRAFKLQNGWSATSANIATRSLKSIFQYAVRQDILEISPFYKIKLLKIAKRTPSFLTLDELKLILTKVKSETLKDLFLFAAFTGLRLGEIVNLKKIDVNLENMQIHVVNTNEFSTKSGFERTVPLHECLVDVVKRQIKNKSVYLFSKKENSYMFSRSYVSHKFKTAFRKTAIDKDIHFHSLRHTTISWGVQNHIDIYVLQQIMGHSSVVVTSGYAHLGNSDLSLSNLPS